MKKLLIGAVAAAAIAAPAANADTTGHVDLGYSSSNLDYGSADYDIDGWVVSGAVITPLSGAWSVQFDASNQTATWDNSDYDNSYSQATAHAIYNGGAWRAGGFAGLGGVYSQTLYIVGAEGQWNFSNFSIDGSITYGATSDAYDYTAWDYRVSGDYFFTPNFAINASISQTELDYCCGGSDITGIGVGAAYRFAGSAITLSGGYTREEWENSGGSEPEADIFRIGASWDFGTGTLQERTQEGASFNNTASFLDVYSRWD